MAKKLTTRQKAALKRHKKHHTAKQLNKIKKDVLGGSTFTAAHKKVKKKPKGRK